MFPYYKDRYTDFFLAIDQRKKDARDGTKTKPPSSTEIAAQKSPRSARRDKDAEKSIFSGYPKLRQAIVRRSMLLVENEKHDKILKQLGVKELDNFYELGNHGTRKSTGALDPEVYCKIK